MSQSLSDHKNFIAAQIAEKRALLALITTKRYWTRQEVAEFAQCSLTRVKDAIARGELRAEAYGMVSRDALIAWLGHDPFLDLTRAIVSLERSLALLAAAADGEQVA